MKIFAHRGASGHYPENTLQAFASALASGCDGIELDVFLHAGELVVIHDRQVDRTTNGQGYLEDFSIEARQRLDAGNGESIPTLWQVLQLCANKLEINIELKGHDTAAAVVTLLQQAQQQLGLHLDTILLSSFHHPLLLQLKSLNPNLQLAVLIGHYPADGVAVATQLGAVALNCDRGFVDAALVQAAHEAELKLYVYTVNQQRELLALRDIGVDGVFCNYPKEALQWLNAHS
ncbi:MAG: glycerophosphodiester phosphodiesterase family protein [Rheinheimera sp.]|nr:glycerophosphodiester phosphodiesterase family protein [Rheinheimera sp.]